MTGGAKTGGGETWARWPRRQVEQRRRVPVRDIGVVLCALRHKIVACTDTMKDWRRISCTEIAFDIDPRAEVFIEVQGGRGESIQAHSN
jgi:hypothetical protein